MTCFKRCPVRLALITCVLLLVSAINNADQSAVNIKELAEIEQRSENLASNTEELLGKDDRGITPLATALLIEKAAKNQDWDTAAKYIDMRYRRCEQYWDCRVNSSLSDYLGATKYSRLYHISNTPKVTSMMDYLTTEILLVISKPAKLYPCLFSENPWH